jgi:predicted Zn-dependent protease
MSEAPAPDPDPEVTSVDQPVWRRRWWFRQPSFAVLLAIAPAVLTAGAVAVAAVAIRLTEPRSLLAVYLSEADRSARARDWKEAVLCLQRASALDPAEPAHRLALVRALDAAGENARADDLLTELTGLSGPDGAKAQVMRAARLLQRERVSTSELGNAEADLTRAVEADPGSAEAHRLLGNLYAWTGRPGLAEPHLAAVAAADPEWLLPLARVCEAAGHKDAARMWAEDAVKVFSARTTKHPADRVSRLKWAEALVRLGKHASAAGAIEEGLKWDGDAPDLLRGLGDVMAAWVDLVEKQRPAALAERMNLLDRGLRRCPAHAGLLAQLATVLRAGGPEADRARARFQELLSDGQAEPTIHFLLGVDAALHGRMEESRTHLEQASRLAPTMPAVANNLAWILAEGPNPDPERALKLIDAAVAADPNEPRFHGTRGHVLVRMKRWKDALAELETALPYEPTHPDVHRDLAAAYEGLGIPGLAAAHRRRAAPPSGSDPKSPTQQP